MPPAVRYRSSSLIEDNVKQFLEKEFVNNGFYFNVASGEIATDGQRSDVLRKVNSNVFESFVNNWIGQTDATGVPGNPVIDPSGISIDGVFHPKDAAPHLPAFDFENGRVILKGSGLVGSEVVSVPGFSYHQIDIDFPGSDRANLLFSQIKDNVQFTQNAFPSGNQQQAPYIIIDMQNTINTGAQLGGGQNVNKLVTFHIVSNDRIEINGINDFLDLFMYRKVIRGVDFNTVAVSGIEQFDQTGDRASTYKSFTELQSFPALAWRKIYIDATDTMERTQFYDQYRNRVDWRINLFSLPPEGV